MQGEKTQEECPDFVFLWAFETQPRNLGQGNGKLPKELAQSAVWTAGEGWRRKDAESTTGAN